jgi:hypothetical protein
MPHYAELDERNVVTRVIVADTREWCEKHLGGRWARTYYSTPGKQYAGIGSEYVHEADNYRPKAPFPSWTFDFEAWQWQAPVPYPADASQDVAYTWHEQTGTWVIDPNVTTVDVEDADATATPPQEDADTTTDTADTADTAAPAAS